MQDAVERSIEPDSAGLNCSVVIIDEADANYGMETSLWTTYVPTVAANSSILAVFGLSATPWRERPAELEAFMRCLRPPRPRRGDEAENWVQTLLAESEKWVKAFNENDETKAAVTKDWTEFARKWMIQRTATTVLVNGSAVAKIPKEVHHKVNVELNPELLKLLNGQVLDAGRRAVKMAVATASKSKKDDANDAFWKRFDNGLRRQAPLLLFPTISNRDFLKSFREVKPKLAAKRPFDAYLDDHLRGELATRNFRHKDNLWYVLGMRLFRESPQLREMHRILTERYKRYAQECRTAEAEGSDAPLRPKAVIVTMSPAEAFFVASVAAKFYKVAELAAHDLPFRPEVTLYRGDWPVTLRNKIRQGFQDTIRTDEIGRELFTKVTKDNPDSLPLYVEQDRPDILVASVGQIGVAVELQRADTMINMGPYPNSRMRMQAPGRIARVGSKFDEVNIYTIHVKGYNKHAIGDTKHEKRRFFEQFLKGIDQPDAAST